jgi:hypothetical protein
VIFLCVYLPDMKCKRKLKVILLCWKAKKKQVSANQTSKGRSFSSRIAPTPTFRSAHHLVAHTCQAFLGSARTRGNVKRSALRECSLTFKEGAGVETANEGKPFSSSSKANPFNIRPCEASYLRIRMPMPYIYQNLMSVHLLKAYYEL